MTGPRDASAGVRFVTLAMALLAAPRGAPLESQVAPVDTTLSLRAALVSTVAAAPAIRLAHLAADAARGTLNADDAPFTIQPQTTISGTQSRSMTTASTVSGNVPGYSYAGLRSTDLQYGLSAPRQFRSGIIVTPTISVDRATESDLPLPAPNRSTVALSVLVPLLRGRGGGRLTGVDHAAALASDASERDARHIMAQSALTTIIAYWSYRSATERLRVFEESESRAARLVRETDRLIEADERPAADRHQLDANLASKVAQRVVGEEAVNQARAGLGLAMGVPAEAIARLPRPGTPLPPLRAPDSVAANHAVREDLAAAELRLQGAQSLAESARHDDRPQLDFTATVGYVGFQTGGAVGRLFDPIYQHIGGPTTTFQVTFSPRIGSTIEQGLRAQDAAAAASARVTAIDLRRTIDANVRTDYVSVGHAIARGARTADAAAMFAIVVDNELQRFQLGSSTLFDVIKAEDDLTQARLDDIDARTAYAVSIAQLAFDSGTLLVHGDARDSVAIDRVAPAAP